MCGPGGGKRPGFGLGFGDCFDGPEICSSLGLINLLLLLLVIGEGFLPDLLLSEEGFLPDSHRDLRLEVDGEGFTEVEPLGFPPPAMDFFRVWEKGRIKRGRMLEKKRGRGGG